MEYEKFDVERALAGEPVILRNGSKAYVRHKEEEFKLRYPLSGVVLMDFPSAHGESWVLSGKVYSTDEAHVYDIVGMYPKEPLTMPDSFWDMLHPNYKVISKDNDETWYAYNEKPEKLDMSWDCSAGNFINLFFSFSHSIFPDCDWEDSLILRPAK